MDLWISGERRRKDEIAEELSKTLGTSTTIMKI
jgi:hypothetical protein